jgi:hypothetical protein
MMNEQNESPFEVGRYIGDPTITKYIRIDQWGEDGSSRLPGRVTVNLTDYSHQYQFGGGQHTAYLTEGGPLGGTVDVMLDTLLSGFNMGPAPENATHWLVWFPATQSDPISNEPDLVVAVGDEATTLVGTYDCLDAGRYDLMFRIGLRFSDGIENVHQYSNQMLVSGTQVCDPQIACRPADDPANNFPIGMTTCTYNLAGGYMTSGLPVANIINIPAPWTSLEFRENDENGDLMSVTQNGNVQVTITMTCANPLVPIYIKLVAGGNTYECIHHLTPSVPYPTWCEDYVYLVANDQGGLNGDPLPIIEIEPGVLGVEVTLSDVFKCYGGSGAVQLVDKEITFSIAQSGHGLIWSGTYDDILNGATLQVEIDPDYYYAEIVGQCSRGQEGATASSYLYANADPDNLSSPITFRFFIGDPNTYSAVEGATLLVCPDNDSVVSDATGWAEIEVPKFPSRVVTLYAAKDGVGSYENVFNTYYIGGTIEDSWYLWNPYTGAPTCAPE